MIPRISRPWTAVAGLAALLTGCIEMDQQIVLNPDGSGKLMINSAVAIPDLGGLGSAGAKPAPNAQARELAVGMLRSEGVEAWTNVKYELGKDGKSRAIATGYFPDITKVRINSQLAGDKVEKESLGISKNAEGNWVFSPADLFASKKKEEAGKTDSGDKPPGDAKEAEKPAAPLTDEEVEAKLAQERQQWAAMKGFMGAFLQGIKLKVSLQGGGTIVESAVFKKEGEQKAALELTGQQLLDSIDKVLQDDAKAKKLIKEGKSPTSGGDEDPEAFFQAAFGESTPRVVLKPGAPAFDYKAEVAKAKATQSAELKALLEDAKKPPKKSELNLNLGGGTGDDATPPADPGEKPGKPPSKAKPRKID